MATDMPTAVDVPMQVPHEAKRRESEHMVVTWCRYMCIKTVSNVVGHVASIVLLHSTCLSNQ